MYLNYAVSYLEMDLINLLFCVVHKTILAAVG